MRQGEDVPLDHVHHAPEDKSVSRQRRLDPNTSVEGTHGPVAEAFAQSRTAVVRCKKGCSYLAQMVVTQYYHLRPCVGRWRQQLGDDCGRYGQLLHKLSCHHDLEWWKVRFVRHDIEFEIGLFGLDQASAFGGILCFTTLHLVLFVAAS